ncbi:hypothetical protein OESDEN_13119, partial [Oesophagostomum dentatum]
LRRQLQDLVIKFLQVLAALCSADRNKRSISCPKGKIRDEDRETFLKYHNDARRRLAKGEQQSIDGNMDGARNMHKLEWDCNLEETVQEVIKSCPSSPKTWWVLGQNTIKCS